MNRQRHGCGAFSIFAAVVIWSFIAAAQADTEFARETENPLAKLITVPLQNNWDFGIGPNEAMKYTLKFLTTVHS